MYRIQGRVKQIAFARPIYGVIVGDDGLDYFFIPSLMNPPRQAYYSLREGSLVEFFPTPTTSGLRAADIAVLCLSPERSISRGEVTPES